MFELTIIDDICSAHFLRGYEGKCKNLHGHTYKIEATVSNETLDDIGMVADFCDLKLKLKEVLEELDHNNLNELEYFKSVNPSAENIAKYIYDNYKPLIAPVKLKQIKVFESERANAVYFE